MTKMVEIESIREPIVTSPGFAKKDLSEYKLDLMGLCGFGCLYCSSNTGNYLRINRRKFAEETKRQLGVPLLPTEDPDLSFIWPDVIDRLKDQLRNKPKSWGAGKTLVFSMLTDGFSPYLVKNGITRQALDLVLQNTSFRIRVLTKNAIVGSADWVAFFKAWEHRVVIGLSIGTLDNTWAKRIEHGASLPTARLKALQRLQAAEVPTYGMLCPIFPDTLEPGKLESLIEAINPSVVETIWAEPFNDRSNWQKVRDGYNLNSTGYEWLTEIYENGRKDAWSLYSRELYERLMRHGRKYKWHGKLKYLLYEKDITAIDAKKMAPFKQILLQGQRLDDGYSKNANIKSLQLIEAVAVY